LFAGTNRFVNNGIEGPSGQIGPRSSISVIPFGCCSGGVGFDRTDRRNPSTIFKTVAPIDGNAEVAASLRHIDDCLSLSQPYRAPDLPADLATVVAAWADLPEALRAGIVAMVKAAWPKRRDI
jgi:hypothetical protein